MKHSTNHKPTPKITFCCGSFELQRVPRTKRETGPASGLRGTWSGNAIRHVSTGHGVAPYPTSVPHTAYQECRSILRHVRVSVPRQHTLRQYLTSRSRYIVQYWRWRREIGGWYLASS
eukprot:3941283-Rhodomonas_salina.4